MATQRKSSASSSGTQRTSTAAKKSPSKKSASKKSTSGQDGSSSGRSGGDAPRAQARRSSGNGSGGSGSTKLSAMKVARSAAQQLAELTGRAPECVIGIERSEDGWVVDLEVVESRRIPDSTDILATYRVQVDEDGELMAYHRAQRYVRGKGGDGDGGRR